MLALIPFVGPVVAILLGAVAISPPTAITQPFVALIVFAAIF
jgi:hypothetical protein